MNQKNNLTTIAEKIQTINPEISKDILDLLFEYILIRYTELLPKNVNNDLQSLFNFLIDPVSTMNKS